MPAIPDPGRLQYRAQLRSLGVRQPFDSDRANVVKRDRYVRKFLFHKCYSSS